MSRAPDRIASLALTHARLHLAEEALRWAWTLEVSDLIDEQEFDQVLRRLRAWRDRAWAALDRTQRRGDRV